MRLSSFLLTAAALVLGAAVASAQQTAFAYQRTVPSAYTPGNTLDITVKLLLNTQNTINATGFEETLPRGWSFVGVIAGTTPTITPSAGETGLLEFAWFPAPTFPVQFTYRVQIAANASGDVILRGQGVVLLSGQGEVRTSVVTNLIDGPGNPPDHSADINGNRLIALDELLRIIQFFNIGNFSCAGNTNDGYQPGPGDLFCAPHASDYAPQDWSIQLPELLRLIQFFNAGGYHPCPAQLTADGYCPGPAS